MKLFQSALLHSKMYEKKNRKKKKNVQNQSLSAQTWFANQRHEKSRRVQGGVSQHCSGIQAVRERMNLKEQVRQYAQKSVKDKQTRCKGLLYKFIESKINAK